jgi:para-aminobenzoate synthetase/4-amino-4-deoxychorismate lyase
MKNHVFIHDATNKNWLHFQNPVEIIEAQHLDEIIPKLHNLERFTQQQELFCAGFISYEAAPAFDSALRVRALETFPLLWFGLYTHPDIIKIPAPPCKSSGIALNWQETISPSAFEQNICRIKERIARGETYQVNYTFALQAPFHENAWELFLNLVRSQQSLYAAFVDTGKYCICCASPELFFQLDGKQLSSRPMKGTTSRGLTFAEDEMQAQWLHSSGKNRAENVMIVDMIRNDMGRLAEVGSVEAPRMFEVERYPTLWQMTSTITSQTNASICNILAALFPCASVTGAPKPKTMEIIAELEATPRGIYTGCIGFIAPKRKAQFNVAIRTVVIDKEAQQASYHVGSGIVWDSRGEEEYRECLIKARVLTEKLPEFSLLETMLWRPKEGIFLLPQHLRRLRKSAAYFNFDVEMKHIEQILTEKTAHLPPTFHKVRLTVSADGTASCEVAPIILHNPCPPVRLRPAKLPIDPNNVFLYHKTTHRRIYEDALTSCPGCDDVLMWNKRHEVTETTIASVIVQFGGRLFTPPIRCGLLPGTYREWLLEQGRVSERIITLEELEKAEHIYLVNSVRRRRIASLITPIS